jgi:ubiquitin-activating enzyme E1
MPINQWMYYDALEALSDEILPEEEVAPGARRTRYDGQIIVFGRTMQRRLAEQSMFLVGAGAIGCEMIKNWALMGVACPEQGNAGGRVHITDMDHIEKSNLSRQFLFRNSDINKPKSRTAATAAQRMNPQLQCQVYETKVAAETENIFGDDFYESLNFVCTALDNVEVKCDYFQIFLIYHYFKLG